MAEYQSIKTEVLAKLETHLPEIRERFGIDTLSLFGSVARQQDTPDSDIDLLYTFLPGKATLQNLNGLRDYTENLFQRKVDLVSRKWIDDILLSSIRNDIITCTPAPGETA
ncbi:MAG TPA: nucleotidyltransferase family protein [Methanocorpusculum sp.]|nr:nucleotidyltransferase family protein [Methanocorpusculum sp.]